MVLLLNLCGRISLEHGASVIYFQAIKCLITTASTLSNVRLVENDEKVQGEDHSQTRQWLTVPTK